MRRRPLNPLIRNEIRALDSLTGSYPTILRTGDDRTGKYSLTFDDRRTILFSSSSNVSFPQVIELSSSINTFKSSLFTSGVIKKGVSDTNLTRIYSRPGQSFSPFNDSKHFNMLTSSFYMTGTEIGILEGFASPLRSKTQIVIDISSATPQTVTRYSNRWDSYDPEGPFVGQRKSGFVYYNHALKRWEEKGLVDNATGLSFPFDYSQYDDTIGDLHSGSNHFPMQFTPPYMNYGSITGLGVFSSSTLEYNINACFPTITSMAPVNMKYHATQSQSYPMSRSINHPFLLEKISVKLPLIALRTHSGKLNTSATGSSASTDANHRTYSTETRAEDDYVFFIYRQKRTNTRQKDGAADVSGSTRYLIGSGSLCFYNSNVFVAGLDAWSPTYAPRHTPAFSYNFNMPSGSISLHTKSIASYTGTVQFNINPSIPTQRIGNYWNVATRENSVVPSPSLRTTMESYWPGGTTYQQVSGNWHGSPALGVSLTYADTGGSPFLLELPTFGLSIIDAQRRLPLVKPDGQATKIFSTLDKRVTAALRFFVTPMTTGSLVLESPYLLMPEDEIIIGIESLLGYSQNLGNEYADNKVVNCITGSQLILTTGDANITLFGSLVQNEREYHNTLNQPLTSDAINEIIHEMIVDQYDISEKTFFTGSSMTEYATGSMFSSSDPRRIVFDAANLTASDPTRSHSFFRGLTAVDNTKVNIDTGKSLKYMFNRSHYGYCRDLLEQSPEGKSYNRVSKMSGSAAVSVIFIDPDSGNPVTGSQTWSSNLSTTATSSLPYFDGEVRNREEPLDIGQIGSTTIVL